jgi:leader peptidase (prepilin peptidase) / N-methyltransferase
MPHLVYAIFFFILGSCIGSFLNVVVWRLPRVELQPESGIWQEFLASFTALSDPPSHCPKCNTRLKWYDNLPIIGWIKLRGRCRFCHEPISMRYPLVEAFTACVFAFYYIAYYVLNWRACCPQPMFENNGDMLEMTTKWDLSNSWPIFVLYLILLAGLIASSLIDAELFIIPTQIPWIIAIIGIGVHTIADRPSVPGSLNLVGEFGHSLSALSAGAAIGLFISMILWLMKIMPVSFPQGEPLLDVDRIAIEAELNRAKLAGEKIEEPPLPPPYAPKEIRAEIRKEILFLLPPMAIGAIWMAMTLVIPSLHASWANLLEYDWFTGLLGSLLGAMAGGFVVWVTRILGTLAFRKVAMGLGDVHLMFGVGAVIGAGGATVAFFLAPFFGILVAIYMLITRKGREIPLGPYLSMATAVVMLCYCQIADYLRPGLEGLLIVIGGWMR